MIKKIIFFCGLLFLSLIGNAQKNDSIQTNRDPDIKIIHTPGVFSARKLQKKDRLKIELIGEDEPIIGYYTFINDSTILVDNTTIKFNTIETLQITNKSSVILGGTLLSVGAMLASSGWYIISQADDSSLTEGIVFGMIGGVAIIGGASCAIIGIIVLSSSTRKYSMDKWNLYIEPEL